MSKLISVNNAITDLLDGMAREGASDLWLEGGQQPVYITEDGMVRLVDYEAMTADEIFEDMAALGLFIEDKWNVNWFHVSEGGTGPAWKFTIWADVRNGNPFVIFRRFPKDIP
jgi:hypothetical protein